ncbi:hypothetical protein RRG08_029412 [Elysia crispata]|uniref:Uncharacterized protein n=1 Tax=Elysia crispata TaxID=231223 RepID=A0AAE1D7P6_9GAST|nr:hypothetical protein RRG08_029412 [Elysia crispata]
MTGVKGVEVESVLNCSLIDFKTRCSQLYTGQIEISVAGFRGINSSNKVSLALSLIGPHVLRVNRGDTTALSDATPPGSPVMLRRSGSTRSTEENVFSRLSTSTLAGENSRPQDKGYITPARGAISASGSSSKSTTLVCTHTAEGHSRAVLAVHATDTLMLTGSKDRTAKLWDLGRGAELLTLPGHPSNVVKVAFCPRAQLAFTVSQSTVRVWDTRRGADACIKTLSSSGLTTSGSAASGRSSDVMCREHQINDIRLAPDGSSLFCAAGNAVQIWDLRRFSQAGRLSGHQAPVMALALTKDSENTLVISGSKDHYIKIFEVIEDAAGILTPKFNLEPPHYDGIQSLTLQGSTLFSGSRDMCIKKWDLHTKQLKHSINAAHKDWVCALDFIPGTDTLVSGCRAGFLKLWQSDTCASLGEVRAHSSAINAIATNTSSIFTASNDSAVRVWSSTPHAPHLTRPGRHRHR